MLSANVDPVETEHASACSHANSADVALLEASIHIKSGELAAAEQVLTGMQYGTPTTALPAVMMRAQLAIISNKPQQVKSGHMLCLSALGEVRQCSSNCS